MLLKLTQWSRQFSCSAPTQLVKRKEKQYSRANRAVLVCADQTHCHDTFLKGGPKKKKFFKGVGEDNDFLLN